MSSEANPSPRKILFFTKFPPPYTGQNIGTLLTYKMLEEQGAELDSINTSFEHLRPSSNKLALIGYSISYSLKTLRLLGQIRAATGRKSYDALYMIPSSSALGQIKDAVSLYVLRRRIPLVVGHIRNGNYADCFLPGRRKRLGDFVQSRVSRFIFLSQGLSERTKDHIPAEKRTVIMNPIDEELQTPAGEAAEKIVRMRDARPLRVLYLGNMIRTKGYEDLLRAAPLLVGKIPFEIHYVGAWLHPNDQKAFEDEVRALGVEASVHHHGPESDRRKVREHFLNAHVFVLPTYYPNEAQPRSIIEAMAAGTPIVATRHASIPEYVGEGQEGYLVEKQDPQGIADAFLKFADPANWERMAKLAREKYETDFSPEKLHAQLCDVLGVRRNSL